MRSLRFDKSGIHLREAAILLATNQDPWASYVECSPEDYWTLGFHYFNSPDFTQAVLTDDALSFKYPNEPPDASLGVHKVILRPAPGIMPGWVILPRP